jgi:hypothetical protein
LAILWADLNDAINGFVVTGVTFAETIVFAY